MGEILLSAIVSTYASERFIQGCLESLAGQTLGERLEIIVIDSGSPQNEGAIVRRFQEKHPNIVYERTPERESLYAAWNRGIRRARGRYLTNANTDDRLRSDALEVLAAALDASPDVALVYADYFITGTENETFENHTRIGVCVRPEFDKALMLSGCQMGPQPMWRRSIHEEIGYFDTKYVSAADYEFWCRIALAHSMKHVRAFLGLYYHNPAGVVNRGRQVSLEETRAIQAAYKDRLAPGNNVMAHEHYFAPAREPGEFVNIGMATFNRLAFTRQAIDALVLNTDFPYVLTVVDNASADGTREYLLEQKRKGVIRNLVLLNENVGVAKASNIAWLAALEANYYLKLDNDIVLQKTGWLAALVDAARKEKRIGVVGYSFEPRSYPLTSGIATPLRVKEGNVGGACALIPKRAWLKLGFWCEEYGLYGEEDADYGVRVNNAGLWNAYMEDENIGLHLPGGKAGEIDSKTLVCLDKDEEAADAQYRAWKDERRQANQSQSTYLDNLKGYAKGSRSLAKPAPFACRFWLNRDAAVINTLKAQRFEKHNCVRVFKKNFIFFGSSRAAYILCSPLAKFKHPPLNPFGTDAGEAQREGRSADPQG